MDGGTNLQRTDAEQGHSHAASTCGQGTNDATFYLIAGQTVDCATDVVQLVVNRRAIMLGPAELNIIFICFLQLPHHHIFLGGFNHFLANPE
jgi:hypothetical protein